MIRDIIVLVEKYSCLETDILLHLHDSNPEIPLFDLSERTSEQIFTLQDTLNKRLNEILADDALVWAVLESYIPPTLIHKLGKDTIVAILNSTELQTYRDAIVSKKIASMAFYRFGQEWENYLSRVEQDFIPSLGAAFTKE